MQLQTQIHEGLVEFPYLQMYIGKVDFQSLRFPSNTLINSNSPLWFELEWLAYGGMIRFPLCTERKGGRDPELAVVKEEL